MKDQEENKANDNQDTAGNSSADNKRERETQAERDKKYDEQRERDRVWREGVNERERQWKAEVRERERQEEKSARRITGSVTRKEIKSECKLIVSGMLLLWRRK